jgi:hypothetical protein
LMHTREMVVIREFTTDWGRNHHMVAEEWDGFFDYANMIVVPLVR